MNKLCVLAASAVVALALGSVAASAGVTPGIGEAAKAVTDEAKAGTVDQIRWRRHHHRRSFFFAPRYRRW